MATVEFNLLCAIEVHSVADIRRILDEGFDARTLIDGKSIITHLTEMYSRSDQFPDCLRLLLDRGVQLDDQRLRSVLLDDADGLAEELRRDPSLIDHRTSMVSAFTPLIGASLLHVAAEYGNLNAARVLVEMGADVNARAAVDEYGLNGHTPLFHTVNSSANRSAPVMRLLLDAGARVDVRLPGITWGKGMEWETTLFDVTPVSYAQLGLLPQVHREERDTVDNIRVLLEAAGRSVPPLENVPNRYLHSTRAVEGARARWRVAPIFIVDDVVATANYYRDTLGFAYDRLWGEPPAFCMVCRSGVVVMLSQLEVTGVVRPNRLADPEGAAWDAYIWIDNADALHAEFKSRGVTITRDVCNQDYGCRDFDVEDCNGYRLCFGQVLAEG